MKQEIKTSIVATHLADAFKNAFTLILITLAALTARAGWKAPVTISGSEDNGYSPGAWIDPEGDTFAAYDDAENSLTELLSIQPPGGSFGAGQLSPDGSNWQNIQMGFDTNGNAIVAWLGLSDVLYAARRTAGANGTFGAVQTVSTNLGTPYLWFWVSVNPSGEALLEWFEPLNPGPNDTGGKVMVATRPAGATTTFGAPQEVASGLLNAGTGDIVNGSAAFLDPDGSATVLWLQDQDHTNHIGTLKQAFRPAGASAFETPVTISSEVAFGNADGAASRTGYGIVTWAEPTLNGNVDSNLSVRADVKMPSTNFISSFKVAGGAEDITRGAIGPDGVGIVTLMLVNFYSPCYGGAGFSRLEAAFVSTNGPLSAPQTISDQQQRVLQNDGIAVGNNGSVFIVYKGYAYTNQCVTGTYFEYAVTGSRKTGLGKPTEISAPGANPEYAGVVAGPDDTAFAFWFVPTYYPAFMRGAAFAPSLNASVTDTNTLLISWPSAATGWQLQENTNLNSTNWTALSGTINDNSTNKFIIVKPTAGNRFYRLTNP